jgi:hypothetical protein
MPADVEVSDKEVTDSFRISLRLTTYDGQADKTKT